MNAVAARALVWGPAGSAVRGVAGAYAGDAVVIDRAVISGAFIGTGSGRVAEVTVAVRGLLCTIAEAVAHVLGKCRVWVAAAHRIFCSALPGFWP